MVIIVNAMPYCKCSVQWCQCCPTPKKICLFGLPKEPKVKKKWIRFVEQSGEKEKGGTGGKKYPQSMMICSKHFPKSAFQNLYQFQMGYAWRLTLKKHAVPLSPEELKEASTNGTETPDSSQSKFEDVEISADESQPEISPPASPKSKTATRRKEPLSKRVPETKAFESKETTGSVEQASVSKSSKMPQGVQYILPKVSVKTPEANVNIRSPMEEFVKTHVENIIKKNLLVTEAKSIKETFRPRKLARSVEGPYDGVIEYLRNGKVPRSGFFQTPLQAQYYAEHFCLSAGGQLLRKSSEYEFGLRKKYVIHTPDRKELVLRYFHVGQRRGHVAKQCHVIERFFWWPSIREDIRMFLANKQGTYPEKSEKTEEPVSRSPDQNRFLRSFGLISKASRRKRKFKDTSLLDHDYLADKLTVKRMICSREPTGPPPIVTRYVIQKSSSRKLLRKMPVVSAPAVKRYWNERAIAKSKTSPANSKSHKENVAELVVTKKVKKKIPRPDPFSIIPNGESFVFYRLLGLEAVVHRLNNVKEKPVTKPNLCKKCGTDYTESWHKTVGGNLCYNCWRKLQPPFPAPKPSPVVLVSNSRQQTKRIQPKPILIAKPSLASRKKHEPKKPFLGDQLMKEYVTKPSSITVLPAKVVSSGPGENTEKTEAVDHRSKLLVETANKIRDQINTRLLLLKKGKAPETAPVKCESPEKVEFLPKRKPITSEDILRSINEGKRAAAAAKARTRR